MKLEYHVWYENDNLYGYFLFRYATKWAGNRLTEFAPEIVEKAALPEDR